MEVPLFPLNALICPGGRLPLQIFEPRYTKMVADSLKHGTPFVIVMLQQGNDTAHECEFFEIGTSAHIVDFDQQPNGLLAITVEGVEKVRIADTFRDDTGLNWGHITAIEPEPKHPVPEKYQDLAGLLKRLVDYPAVSSLNMDINYRDSAELGCRLTELLPSDRQQKQFLLELQDPLYRLEQVQYFLSLLEG